MSKIYSIPDEAPKPRSMFRTDTFEQRYDLPSPVLLLQTSRGTVRIMLDPLLQPGEWRVR